MGGRENLVEWWGEFWGCRNGITKVKGGHQLEFRGIRIEFRERDAWNLTGTRREIRLSRDRPPLDREMNSG